jgi:hypothetical protein
VSLRFVSEKRTEQGIKEIIVGPFEQKKQAEEAAGDVTVYYSTPFGDTKDGKQKPFLLARDGVPFFPVFYSTESMKEFYERMNRGACMILEGNINAVTDTLRSIEPLKSAGIVIEPFSEHPVEIMPNS